MYITEGDGGFGGPVRRVRKLTQYEAEVAATVIQALGTNWGWSFLATCFERTGHYLKKNPNFNETCRMCGTPEKMKVGTRCKRCGMAIVEKVR